MLSDESRGWAFTRALLGLPARTLHVCGDPAVLPLLRAIVAETGDHLEVRQYERLSPLAPARRPLEGLDQVQRGDCVVSFSRREVHAVRQEIEAYGRERCCVVYGALPPAARQLQAELFNTPRTGAGSWGGRGCFCMGRHGMADRVRGQLPGLGARPAALPACPSCHPTRACPCPQATMCCLRRTQWAWASISPSAASSSPACASLTAARSGR